MSLANQPDRLLVDPGLDVMPDFDSAASYQPVLAGLTANGTVSRDDAIKTLQDAWSADHASRVNAWQAQCDRDADEARCRDEQARLDAEAAAAAAAAEALKAQEELEKKRVKLPPLNPTAVIASQRDYRPAPLVFDKLLKREWFELWYVCPEGRQECDGFSRSDSDAGFTLAKDSDSGSLTFATVASSRRSPKAKPDEQLTMSEISLSKTCLLDCMQRTGWPDDVVQMFTQFYLALENHRLRQVAGDHGDRVMVIYHAEARRRFYEAISLKEGELPNLAIINEERIAAIERDLYREEHLRRVRAFLSPSLSCLFTVFPCCRVWPARIFMPLLCPFPTTTIRCPR
ncbi:hypothetical protein EV714DRAFT_211785 [Schizophyllum commune]